jgi:hypothetical protein
MFQEASGHLGKMEAEERRLFRDNVIDVNCKPVNETSTPGAPILVSRTDTTMTFRPSIFMARTGEQVVLSILVGCSCIIQIAVVIIYCLIALLLL